VETKVKSELEIRVLLYKQKSKTSYQRKKIHKSNLMQNNVQQWHGPNKGGPSGLVHA
jgi:hypothetical protein